MLAPVGGSTGVDLGAGARAVSAAGGRPSDYAADWGPSASPTPGAPSPTPAVPSPAARTPAHPTPSPSPGPAPRPPHVSTPAEQAAHRAAERTRLQTAKVDAGLAEDVYNDAPKPPAGYHAASGAELTRLGLTPEMLDDGRSDFSAQVYVGPGDRTVIAFRGSQSKEDWKNDIQQGVGLKSEYYNRAIDIGQRVARSGVAVTFTGHSLGGGLASAAAVASGGRADTFNAAGITSGTLDAARSADRAAGGDGKGAQVNAYYDTGDPLSKFQDSNALEDGVLGGLGGFILGGPLGGILGGGLGGVAGHVPSAFGERRPLATVDPPGGPTGLDKVEARHGMDYIQRGLDSALAQLH